MTFSVRLQVSQSTWVSSVCTNVPAFATIARHFFDWCEEPIEAKYFATFDALQILSSKFEERILFQICDVCKGLTSCETGEWCCFCQIDMTWRLKVFFEFKRKLYFHRLTSNVAINEMSTGLYQRCGVRLTQIFNSFMQLGTLRKVVFHFDLMLGWESKAKFDRAKWCRQWTGS